MCIMSDIMRIIHTIQTPDVLHIAFAKCTRAMTCDMRNCWPRQRSHRCPPLPNNDTEQRASIGQAASWQRPLNCDPAEKKASSRSAKAPVSTPRPSTTLARPSGTNLQQSHSRQCMPSTATTSNSTCWNNGTISPATRHRHVLLLLRRRRLHYA